LTNIEHNHIIIILTCLLYIASHQQIDVNIW